LAALSVITNKENNVKAIQRNNLGENNLRALEKLNSAKPSIQAPGNLAEINQFPILEAEDLSTPRRDPVYMVPKNKPRVKKKTLFDQAKSF